MTALIQRREYMVVTLLREALGDVLRRTRTSQGRTLREVSDSARVSLGYLSEVERGRKEASSELLNAICGALGIRLSTVVFDAGRHISGAEVGAVPVAPAVSPAAVGAKIDAGTKVVIPPVGSLAAV